MFDKIISFILGTPTQSQQTANVRQISAYKRAAQERELIKRESKVGATLFGPIPAGHQREFFCLGEHIWIWDEQWFDESVGAMAQMHVRYEFQRQGVLKTVDGVARGYITGPELTNLLKVIQTYDQRVAVEVYGYIPAHA